jgi:hypothetical protein
VFGLGRGLRVCLARVPRVGISGLGFVWVSWTRFCTFAVPSACQRVRILRVEQLLLRRPVRSGTSRARGLQVFSPINTMDPPETFERGQQRSG